MGPLFLEFNQNAFGFCQCGVWIFLLFLQAAVRIPNCCTVISGFNKYRGGHLITLRPGAGFGNLGASRLLVSLPFD